VAGLIKAAEREAKGLEVGELPPIGLEIPADVVPTRPAPPAAKAAQLGD
jgi:hypothetical protein